MLLMRSSKRHSSFFSYLLFIESYVFVPMPGVSEFWDPFFLVSFTLLSPLLLGVDLLTVLSYAGVGASVGWAFVGGLLAASCTGEVEERERKDGLRDEIFSSDDPDEFLDGLIARAYADQGDVGMKQTISDLKGMVSVCDTKGATIRKAFERYEKRKNAPPQNDSESGSLSQTA